MLRIPTLLQKLTDLSQHPEQKTVIDIDLMMDYTRVLYADLMEWRDKLRPPSIIPPAVPLKEPTLSEIAAAMEATQKEVAGTAGTSAPSIELSTDIGPFEEKRDRPLPPRTIPVPPPFSPPKPPVVPLQKDIRSLIGINDKYQFISELFGNDKAAYEETLNELNRMGTEQQARHWLNDRLWVRDEHSQAMQVFYELLAHFFSKG